jgi:hypothetical protein
VSEEEIIAMIVEALHDANCDEEKFLSISALEPRAKALYAKIKLQEQSDRMPKGKRPS